MARAAQTSRLKSYRAKRNFATTREPSGEDSTRIVRAPYRRFVIQKHDATRLHYDLRLEVGDTFRSWAVTRGPSLDPGEKRLAVEVEDHPLAYGDFEGTIPKGAYGGGTVMLWDRGFWMPDDGADPEAALAQGELKFSMAGEKLQGGFVLVRLKRKSGEKRDNWLLIKHRDTWATPGTDTVLDKDRSVASGRTMQQIADGKGSKAKPFMTGGRAVAATAVWDSQRDAGAALAQTKQPRASKKASGAPPAAPKLTHPERVLWPDTTPPLTKRELADYLAAMAPWMMQHVGGRPCSLLRAPDGITGQLFFQRHALNGNPGLLTQVTVDRKHQPYLQIDSAEALVSLAQLNVIELHPWNSAPGQPDVPGRLVFDLDPAPDVAFAAVVAGAKELQARLTKLELVPFAKTTGGKGMHVVVPLKADASVSWEQAKMFAHTVSAQMADDSPDLYLVKMTKKARKGRIFLDYLRNEATATAVAPLSPRARPGATVSMPLTWSQVRADLDPARFTIRTAPGLMAKSAAWTDYAAGAKPLARAIAKLIGGK